MTYTKETTQRREKQKRTQAKIGKALKEWRQSENLVLTDISKKIKCGQGTLSDIENGKIQPSFFVVRGLVKGYPGTHWNKILWS